MYISTQRSIAAMMHRIYLIVSIQIVTLFMKIALFYGKYKRNSMINEKIRELKIKLEILIDDAAWHAKRSKSIELSIIDLKEKIAELESDKHGTD